MSLVSVKKLRDKSTAKRDENGEVRIEVYQVIYDAITDGPWDALTADDTSIAVPDYLAAWPADTSFRVRDKNASHHADLVYHVTVEYRNFSSFSGPPPEDDDPDPTARPADIRWGFIAQTRAIDADVDGDPIANTANDPFDPPLEDDQYIPVVTIERNVSSRNPQVYIDAMNKVNSASIAIAGKTFAAGTGLIINAGGVTAYEAGVSFIRETFEIAYAPDWQRHPLDAGYYQLVAGDKNRIMDDQGKAVEAPWPLNGSGARVATASIPASVVFLSFEIKDEVAFSALSLPTTFPA